MYFLYILQATVTQRISQYEKKLGGHSRDEFQVPHVHCTVLYKYKIKKSEKIVLFLVIYFHILFRFSAITISKHLYATYLYLSVLHSYRTILDGFDAPDILTQGQAVQIPTRHTQETARSKFRLRHDIQKQRLRKQ
jgi:hypothetical protein